MNIDWRKYVFFKLMTQTPAGPNENYLYHCQLCGTSSEVRYRIYFHLETAHHTQEIINFLCDLPLQAGIDEIISFLCGGKDAKIIGNLK